MIPNPPDLEPLSRATRMCKSDIHTNFGAFGDDSEEKAEKHNPHNLIPTVRCGEVTNGVVAVAIYDFFIDDTIVGMTDPCPMMTDPCLEIKYYPVDGPRIRHKSLTIARAEIGRDGTAGYLYFKVPFHLNAYNFQFSISGIHYETGSDMAESPMQSVAVPSFLKDNNFKKGDTVSFRGITPSIS